MVDLDFSQIHLSTYRLIEGGDFYGVTVPEEDVEVAIADAAQRGYALTGMDVL